MMAFQTATYAFCLIIYTAVALAILSRIVSAAYPSARVANSVLNAATNRLWSAGAPLLGWLVLVVVFGLLLSGHSDFLSLPPPGSAARIWGNNIATLGVFYWVSQGVTATSGAGVLYTGLKPSDEAYKLARYAQACVLAILGLGPLMFALFRPGPFASVGISIAVLCGLGLQYNGLRLLAVIRRNRAPRASAIETIDSRIRPYAAQLSDIHLVLPGSQLVQGGEGGNQQLAFLVKRWTSTPEAAPRIVLITGDIIDRGQSDEWDVAMPMLRALRAQGMRVLLAPGNHDLATAYQHSIAGRFMAHSSARFRFVDTHRIFNYLRWTAELEPDIESYDGRRLGALLESEQRIFADFVEAWRFAAEAAASELEARGIVPSRSLSGRADPRDLRSLAARFPQAASPLLDPLIAQAVRILALGDADLREEVFTRELLKRSDFTIPSELELGVRWRKLWYGAFPLRLVDEKYRVEYLIVNSNAPEPGLAGSGFGCLEAPQIERLRQLVKTSRARTLVILMHHAVCGWIQEPGDRHGTAASIDRWAFLAHETNESHEVLELLGNDAPESCERVFLCCGHRHGVSRVGPVVNATDGMPMYPRLVVMESAALPGLSFEPPDSRSENAVLGLFCASEQTLSACTVSLL